MTERQTIAYRIESLEHDVKMLREANVRLETKMEVIEQKARERAVDRAIQSRASLWRRFWDRVYDVIDAIPVFRGWRTIGLTGLLGMVSAASMSVIALIDQWSIENSQFGPVIAFVQNNGWLVYAAIGSMVILSWLTYGAGATRKARQEAKNGEVVDI